MGSPRGDASVTRQAILQAARELFAAHGVDGVSVRRIAARAGVNHALVHRYFGAKDEMVAAILVSEAEKLGSIGRPEEDERASLATLREVLQHVLTENRTSLILMLRAEMDGVAPEQTLETAPLRPLRIMQQWLAEHHRDGAGMDPAAVTMVIGAAMLGLVAAQPMLMNGAGLTDEDPGEVLQRCMDVLVGLAGLAIAAPPAVPDSGVEAT